MKSFLAIVSALGICASMFSDASAQHVGYGWSISHSVTDPMQTSGLPNGDIDNLFLWYLCSDYTDGMSAAEMTLVSIPPGQVIAFTPMNGFLNAGTATNLLLAVGGCPSAVVVAGRILILHFAPLAVCLGGANVTVDCSPNPQAWPHERRGYTDADLPLCLTDSEFLCVWPVSVEKSSWGWIKNIYR